MKSIAKILGLAGVLLLGSCSKEDSSPLTSSVQSSTGSGVYLSGSIGLDEARSLSHTIEKGSPTESTMYFGQVNAHDSSEFVRSNVARYKPRASFSGTRSEVLLVLKSDNASQPVNYVKVPVTHKDDRSFDIDGNVDVALAPGTNLSVGNWYALGFVYSSGKSSGQTVAFNEATKRLEVTAPSGGTYTASEFDASTETGNTLTAPSVYMFDWMPLQVTTSGGKTKAKLSNRAQLKPQGALLLVEVSNLSMRNIAYDPVSTISWEHAWRQRPVGMQEGDDIWVDSDGNRAYAKLNRMTLSLLKERYYLDTGGPIPPAGSLDGHFDLSTSALDVTRSPKLKMGTTHRMEINYPERRYYFSEKDQDKPMHWSAVWIAPTEGASATSETTTEIKFETRGHDAWLFLRRAQYNGFYFYEPSATIAIPGVPHNGTVVYRQIQWGYWWFGNLEG